MQKRVKTYGKHSSRIITFTEDKQTAIPQSTATSVTQPALNSHVSSSTSSDDLDLYSNRATAIPNSKRKMSSSQRNTSSVSQPPEELAKAKPVAPHQARKQAQEINTKQAYSSRDDSKQRPITTKARAKASSIRTSKPGKKNEAQHHSSRVIESSESSEVQILKSKPSVPKPGGQRKYIVSDDSETSSFESTSEAEEPIISSSSEDKSASPISRHTKKDRTAFPSDAKRQPKNPTGLSVKAVPLVKPLQPKSKSSDRKDETIQMSSDSDEIEVISGTHKPSYPGNSRAGTPQVKASHLRHARMRKATPFRHIPRISLASTLTLSPVSPLNLLGKKPPVSNGRVATQVRTPEPHLPISQPPSSPLTWDESLTPEAVRILDVASDDEDQVSSAVALQKLLKLAGQAGPVDFAAFLESFRTRDIETVSSLVKRDKARTVQRASLKYRKIGDASYSEVFSIGDLVLKIIPLAVEIEVDSEDDSEEEDVEVPFKSPPESVLKEVMITKATGDAVEGFIKLLKTYIVKGKYPRTLIKEWDEFKRNNGSDGIRPDSFTEHQLYSIVVLPNGGIDLESYSFGKATASSGSAKGGSTWRDAAEVFWQVTKALAKAEELLKFEHRDLHWGQIVVQKSKAAKGEEAAISATIIDLGLSRIETGKGVQFSLFEDEVFTGSGILPGPETVIGVDEEIEPDYQFDIYRLMRHYNGDEWTSYKPLTNVMWLHYLSSKLLRHKGLRKPTTKPSATLEKQKDATNISTTMPHLESEHHAYQQLVAVEHCLGARLEPIVDEMVLKYGKGKQSTKSKKQGRPPKVSVDKSSKTSAMSVESASDVAVLWFARAL